MKPGTKSSREDEFIAMAETYGQRFRRIAASYAKGQDAEDLMQEIWLQVWRSLQSFDNQSKLETWAYRIALNTAISYRRKPKRTHLEIDETAHAGSTPTPDDTSGLLEEFLNALPPIDRAVLLLHLDDKRSDEIADVLGTSPAAIATRLTRIRQFYESRYL